MDLYIQSGTRFTIEVGTPRHPKVIRWTTWGNRDIQQSFLLHTSDGTVIVDPVQPIGKAAIDALKAHAGEVSAIVCTCPNHYRDSDWFRSQFNAPLLGPREASDRSTIGLEADERYSNGDTLPGGIQAIASGSRQGEAWLQWKASPRKQVLIAADTIYGQTQRGGFDGAPIPYWICEGGIRLQMERRVTRTEMKRRFGRLDAVEFDLILNGHNPRPIENAKSALRKVLLKGKLETHPKGAFTFLWTDLT